MPNDVQVNYVLGNKIFILTTLEDATTNDALGEISDMIDKLPWKPVFTQTPLWRKSLQKLESPYNLTSEYPPVIDIYINSLGGDCDILLSISSLLTLARSKGAIIRTSVIGTAGSCASMLAVQGTPNFRIMYDNTYHFLHFGTTNMIVERNQEIRYVAHNTTQHHKKLNDIYLRNTKLNQKDLNKYYAIEGSGSLYANECLRKGICDWVVSPDGTFIKCKDFQR